MMFAFIDLLYDQDIILKSQGIADTKQPVPDGWVRMAMDDYLVLDKQLQADIQAQDVAAQKAKEQADRDLEQADQIASDIFLSMPKPTLDDLTQQVMRLTKFVHGFMKE